MRLLRGALVQLAVTPEPLLPWLPDEVDRLEIRAMPPSKESATVLLIPYHQSKVDPLLVELLYNLATLHTMISAK